MGRNAHPVAIHLLNNNKNRLTHAEIERRESSQIKIKNKEIKASQLVQNMPAAFDEFNRLMELYKEIPFVGSLDEHLINQYCLSVAELEELLKMLDLTRFGLESSDPMEKMNAVGMYIKIDTGQKWQEIARLSDRLYLNPVSRTKNVPSKKEEPPKSKEDYLFD